MTMTDAMIHAFTKIRTAAALTPVLTVVETAMTQAWHWWFLC